ncbi:aminoacyl-tRNA hydrolase [Eisenibacter elegans]|jgi:PTH1 family peptidyl-tRNA hydrolase|uniref:aminoacyl-tRNA hydrolase n=1 Tax=Eisenibacter elegans TaxID=997 RepID=UPI0003FC8E4F|nr:aminoacyl-tRNA hydrolase [Eisenibacter elegans]
MNKYLIVGLGNPGGEYELTRHNIGFLVLDQLADKLGVNFEQQRHGEVAEAKYKGRTLVLLKPNTYMNLSGKAVNYWLQAQKITVDNLVVVTDDVSLPHAKLRLRSKGSAGGHNGLQNIEDVLGTQQYARLRFGIGNEYAKGQQADYVLSNFSKEQLDTLLEPLQTSCDALLAITTIGLEQAMNQFNKK